MLPVAGIWRLGHVLRSRNFRTRCLSMTSLTRPPSQVVIDCHCAQCQGSLERGGQGLQWHRNVPLSVSALRPEDSSRSKRCSRRCRLIQVRAVADRCVRVLRLTPSIPRQSRQLSALVSKASSRVMRNTTPSGT